MSPPLNITLKSPHLANPRQGVEEQPDGTLKVYLVVDCDLDENGPSEPGTPLADVIDEMNNVVTNFPFDGYRFNS